MLCIFAFSRNTEAGLIERLSFLNEIASHNSKAHKSEHLNIIAHTLERSFGDAAAAASLKN